MKRTMPALLAALLFSGLAQGEVEMLVLMHGTGKVERYGVATGRHVGTLLTGLPPSNAILPDADGRLLISTGLPGGMGTVLRFDPGGGGKVETLIDVPEGYGGRLLRATGMVRLGRDLLVASQGDGKVKRYAYPSGEWLADVASASPGGMTQIAVRDGRLYVTEFSAQTIGRTSDKLDGGKAEAWIKSEGHSPWGLVLDNDGRAFFCTSSNRILRFDGKSTTEWAGAKGGLSTPIGLAIGPDGLLHAANLSGGVTSWKLDRPNAEPVRSLTGPEMKSPISICFAEIRSSAPFIYHPPVDTSESPEKLAFFEEKIRPLLLDRCVGCHGAKKQEGGLRLDSREAMLEGGDSGSPIRPGKPDESLLVRAVRHVGTDLKMPPKKKLANDEIESLSEWIRQGAAAPGQAFDSSASLVSSEWETEFRKRLDWWSLKPPVMTPTPRVSGVEIREPYDAYIASALARVGLKPAAPASPEVLLRRLSFVLTGLPPTPDDRDRFLTEGKRDTEAAYAALADRYLASPRFGERFARHWMDVVRYTDTYGYEWDNPAKGSHEYRDYLVRAYNADIGFDTLVREQLAGDLLPTPRIDKALGINESMIGPMFHHMGEHRHGSSIAANGVHQEMVNNKIDAFSKAFLALTAACSRCHDHKLDPISQRDYYALGAVFMTPRWTTRAADAPGKNAEAIARLKSLREAVRDELGSTWRSAATTLDPMKLAETGGKAAPKIEDPAYPIARLAKAKGEIGPAWASLAKEWRETREARLKANTAFRPLGDLARGVIPKGWVIEGEGIENGRVDAGTPLVALEGDRVVARLLPAGLHSHALSSKLPGALRMPPEDKIEGKVTSVNVAGAEFGGYLVLEQNAFQGEGVTFLTTDEPSWKSFADTPLKHGVTKVTVEFSTASLNPNFPPRTGLAKGLPNNDLGYDKRSRLSITGIVTHDAPGAPSDTLDVFADLYREPLPKTAAESDARLRNWIGRTLTRWSDRKPAPGDERLLNALLERGLLPNSAKPGDRLAWLVDEYRRVERSIPFPRTVNGMDERALARSGLHFNVRGNVDVMADLVPPDFLSLFEGRNDVSKSNGSGRLELADSLLRPDHPLTSRVYVNRVWRWVFGEGLVATPDDFGRLGERPSNLELLDRLAIDFSNDGWSTKRLVRRLVLSATFKQSGNVDPPARTIDPSNRLLHHYPTRRLEAEAIRDNLLAVSGRLDPSLGGRPINPHRAAEDGAKRLYSGPLDGNGRRSIYLNMSIMAPPTFLTAFDLPDLKLPSGRRNVTNVPTQSLLLMNDPLVTNLAERWGSELVKRNDSTPEDRVRRMFIAAYAREPRPAELKAWRTAAVEFSTGPDVMRDQAAWARLAHAIFNTAEFIYYR